MSKLLIESKDLQIRTLVDSDKTQLEKWLSNPEVLQYYEGRENPFDMEKVEQEFFDDEDCATRCLIEFGEIPIGYVQFYEIDDEERKSYGYADSKEVIYGMDQFIGESTYWNKGVCTQLVRAVVRYLIRERGAHRIVMDPQIQSERALHCYGKCGFKKVKLLPRHEWHEGKYRDCWSIEYRK